MTAPWLMLPPAVLRRIVDVLDAPTEGFVALTRVAGLDPTLDFLGADLREIDFGTDDLGEFNFSGADLTGADLSHARGLDRLKSNAATRWPATMRHPPPDFDPEAAQRLILAGQAPPRAWWPFITKLDLQEERFADQKPRRDLSLLAGLTALQRLDLDGTQVSDVSPLAGLTALESLSLSGTQVSDVSPLAGLAALGSLDLSDTQVSDVSLLAGLTALQRLDLDGTQVSDVSPLAGLTALQRLDLDGTQVSDLSPLAGLTALQRLDLDGTQVSDVSPLAGLAALESLSLSGTQVSNTSVLERVRGLQIAGIGRRKSVRPDRQCVNDRVKPGHDVGATADGP